MSNASRALINRDLIGPRQDPRRHAGQQPAASENQGKVAVGLLAWRANSEDKNAARPKRAGGLQPSRRYMQGQNDRELREELVKLRAEHRLLDEEIVALETSGTADQLLIRRLKKRKLGLKDQITAVEDQLTPDIIA